MLYEFDEYGRLVKNSGWKAYEDGKWRYFVPETYGAYRFIEKIDGELFIFDSNGYCIKGRVGD